MVRRAEEEGSDGHKEADVLGNSQNSCEDHIDENLGYLCKENPL